MPSFSHIPKRKTRLTSCMDFGQRIMYSMWWIQHRPHLTTQAAVVHAPELQMQMYVRHAAWMTICFILHSVIAPTTWSVSCCRPLVLLPAVILLLYDRIVEYIRTLHDYVPSTDSLALYSVPAPHTFLRLFGRPANTNYGRFGTGVERPMLVPSFYYWVNVCASCCEFLRFCVTSYCFLCCFVIWCDLGVISLWFCFDFPRFC